MLIFWFLQSNINGYTCVKFPTESKESIWALTSFPILNKTVEDPVNLDNV